jgi:hypothetical protein
MRRVYTVLSIVVAALVLTGCPPWRPWWVCEDDAGHQHYCRDLVDLDPGDQADGAAHEAEVSK